MLEHAQVYVSAASSYLSAAYCSTPILQTEEWLQGSTVCSQANKVPIYTLTLEMCSTHKTLPFISFLCHFICTLRRTNPIHSGRKLAKLNTLLWYTACLLPSNKIVRFKRNFIIGAYKLKFPFLKHWGYICEVEQLQARLRVCKPYHCLCLILKMSNLGVKGCCIWCPRRPLSIQLLC